jgi:3',5'-cyclic AMP phosphodiesterase CpdA
MTMPLTCAQLSDLHLDGTDTTRNRLRRIAEQIAAFPERVDALIVSGDIVEGSAFSGTAPDAALAEYRFVHDLLSPLGPVVYSAGNSDGEAFDRFLVGLGIAAHYGNSRLDVGDVSFLMVNSRVTGAYHGHLDDAAAAWLAGELERATSAAVIVMHHPPLAFGHPVIDRLRLDNPAVLEKAIRRFPHVIGILCGHTHAAASTLFAERPLFVAPGVHSYGQLPWAYTDGSTALIDPMTPPGYALHRVEADRLTSYPILLDRSEVDR